MRDIANENGREKRSRKILKEKSVLAAASH
jgi:hypothetical protein